LLQGSYNIFSLFLFIAFAITFRMKSYPENRNTSKSLLDVSKGLSTINIDTILQPNAG